MRVVKLLQLVAEFEAKPIRVHNNWTAERQNQTRFQPGQVETTVNSKKVSKMDKGSNRNFTLSELAM